MHWLNWTYYDLVPLGQGPDMSQSGELKQKRIWLCDQHNAQYTHSAWKKWKRKLFERLAVAFAVGLKQTSFSNLWQRLGAQSFLIEIGFFQITFLFNFIALCKLKHASLKFHNILLYFSQDLEVSTYHRKMWNPLKNTPTTGNLNIQK